MPRKPNSAAKQTKTKASRRPVTHDTAAARAAKFAKIDELEPDMPDWLKKDKVAVAEWQRMIPLLANAGLLSPLYGVPLAMLCTAYSTMQHCQKKIAKDGPTFYSPNGHVCQRPEVTIGQKASADYLKLCEHFALTPKTSVMKIGKTVAPLSTPAGGSGKKKGDEQFEQYFNQDRSALARR